MIIKQTTGTSYLSCSEIGKDFFNVYTLSLEVLWCIVYSMVLINMTAGVS